MKLETVTTRSGSLFLMHWPDVFCKALLETTSGEEVFAFIAVGTGNDDHQMEVIV